LGNELGSLWDLSFRRLSHQRLWAASRRIAELAGRLCEMRLLCQGVQGDSAAHMAGIHGLCLGIHGLCLDIHGTWRVSMDMSHGNVRMMIHGHLRIIHG
jgi:hypothetical protein